MDILKHPKRKVFLSFNSHPSWQPFSFFFLLLSTMTSEDFENTKPFEPKHDDIEEQIQKDDEVKLMRVRTILKIAESIILNQVCMCI